MIATIRKAVAAAGFACLAALGGVMLDGNLTVPELVFAGGVGLVAGFGTYAAPANATQRPTRKASR